MQSNLMLPMQGDVLGLERPELSEDVLRLCIVQRKAAADRNLPVLPVPIQSHASLAASAPVSVTRSVEGKLFRRSSESVAVFACFATHHASSMIKSDKGMPDETIPASCSGCWLPIICTSSKSLSILCGKVT